MNGYYGNYYMPTDVKVAPINITINSNNDCVIRQPEKMYFVDNTRIIVPEINISIHKKQNNNRRDNYRRDNYRRDNYRRNNYRRDNYRRNNYRRNNYRRNNYRRNNFRKRENDDIPSDFKPPFKMMRINLDDIMKSNSKEKTFESVLKKIFGLEKNETEKKLEAPIESESNFDMKKEYEKLPFEVKDLNDLILLSEIFSDDKPHQYGINMKRLHMIKESLRNINNIIGMKNVKKIIFNKLITYLQGLGNLNDMNHIVIQAPPGYGKTMLGFYLSEIFYKLGLIKKEISSDDKDEDKKYTHPFTGENIDFPFIIAKRKDLIGKYVGHTAPQVESMVEKALGGVLFIDEAYSLGSKSSNESYSDECINTINQLLSEKAGQFICIIAGYKDQLENSFFTNPGLKRRFRTVFEIDKYSPNELSLIMKKMINDTKWKIDSTVEKNLEEFMKKNINNFKYCAGDIEKLLQNIRNAHSNRVLGLHPRDKKIINMDDINNGLKLFLEMNNEDEFLKNIQHSLYI